MFGKDGQLQAINSCEKSLDLVISLPQTHNSGTSISSLLCSLPTFSLDLHLLYPNVLPPPPDDLQGGLKLE